jgi:Mce-associated membrane protein
MAKHAVAPAGQLIKPTDDPSHSGGETATVTVKAASAEPISDHPRDSSITLDDTEDSAVPQSRDSDGGQSTVVEGEDDPPDENLDVVAGTDGDGGPTHKAPFRGRTALLAGIGIVAVLGGLVGWLGVRAERSHNAQIQRGLFLQVGKQAAINLTTIDWQQADRDVQRILDSASGAFRDDFTARSRPFIDLVKQSQSTTVGTVTEAGLESESGNSAQVLVAVTVRTSNSADRQQDPRSWRMRIAVEKAGDGVKVSNVQFVP